MAISSRKVTIKSIAQELGVSFSTVSKALNDDPNVSEQTRAMVRQKAEELHYTRNYFASSLREQGSKTVAILANDFEIPAYSEMMNAIADRLFSHGYVTLISNSQYNERIERSNLETILSRQPEAIIISPIHPDGENMRLLTPYYDRTLVLGKPADETVSSVCVDHRRSGYLSAGLMLQADSRNNLVFAGPELYQASAEYLAGVEEAYAEYGLRLPQQNVVHFRPAMQAACDRFLDLWNQHPGYTGVICFCDSMALGIYQAAAQLGLRIPDDLNVIGYDDADVDAFTAPPLTTIHMPKMRMAQTCAEFVIDRLLYGDTSIRRRMLEPELICRGSVRSKIEKEK